MIAITILKHVHWLIGKKVVSRKLMFINHVDDSTRYILSYNTNNKIIDISNGKDTREYL